MEMSGSDGCGRPSSAGTSYSLKWNKFHTHLANGMNLLLEEEEFTDVTLASDGQFLKAHKLVLASCSPYFKRLFQANSSEKSGSTIVILQNVRFRDLENVIRFVYRGQTNVAQDDLSRFLKTGELLQIEGLSQTIFPNEDDTDEGVPFSPIILSTRTQSVLPEEIDHSKTSSVDNGGNRFSIWPRSSANDGIHGHPPYKRPKATNSTTSVLATAKQFSGQHNILSNENSRCASISADSEVHNLEQFLNMDAHLITRVQGANVQLLPDKDPLGLTDGEIIAGGSTPKWSKRRTAGVKDEMTEKIINADVVDVDMIGEGVRQDYASAINGEKATIEEIDGSVSSGPAHPPNLQLRRPNPGLHSVRPAAMSIPLTRKRKRGRPSNAKKVEYYMGKNGRPALNLNHDTYKRVKRSRYRNPGISADRMEPSIRNIEYARTSGQHFLLDRDETDMQDSADNQTSYPTFDEVKTPVSRFLCVLCGKSYRSKNVLYNHRSVYHRSEYKKNELLNTA